MSACGGAVRCVAGLLKSVVCGGFRRGGWRGGWRFGGGCVCSVVGLEFCGELVGAGLGRRVCGCVARRHELVPRLVSMSISRSKNPIALKCTPRNTAIAIRRRVTASGPFDA